MTGSGVPASGPEVIAKLVRLGSSTALIAAEDHAARGVPVIDGLEVALLHQAHAHVGVIDPHLRGDVTHLHPHRGEHFEQVVAFAAQKLRRKIRVPREFAVTNYVIIVFEAILPNSNLQFVVEEVVQAFGCFPGIMILKLLIKLPNNEIPRALHERIHADLLAPGSEGPDFPFPGGSRPGKDRMRDVGCEINTAALQDTILHLIGAGGETFRCARDAALLTSPHSHPLAGNQFQRIQLRLGVKQIIEQILRTFRRVDGVGAQANAHIQFTTLLGYT